MLKRRDIRRLVVKALLLVVISILALTTIGLLIASLLLGFLTVTQPAVAVLLTALCVAVITSLLLMILVSNKRRRHTGLGGLDQLLPGLENIVRQKPIGAVGTALILGVVAELMQKGGRDSTRRRR